MPQWSRMAPGTGESQLQMEIKANPTLNPAGRAHYTSLKGEMQKTVTQPQPSCRQRRTLGLGNGMWLLTLSSISLPTFIITKLPPLTYHFKHPEAHSSPPIPAVLETEAPQSKMSAAYCNSQLINIGETQRSLDENCSGGIECRVSLTSYYLIRASVEPRGLHG